MSEKVPTYEEAQSLLNEFVKSDSLLNHNFPGASGEICARIRLISPFFVCFAVTDIPDGVIAEGDNKQVFQSDSFPYL